MTTPDPATPARIGRMPEVTAMSAFDTIDLLADRVQRLLSHRRRMTLVGRWLDGDETPDVEAGLTVREPLEVRRTHGGTVVTAHLHPALARTFGFSASTGIDDTEAEAWTRYHHPSGERQGLTWIRVSGGLPGNGPATTDQIVIRNWNNYNRGRETVVAFDNDLAPVMTVVAGQKLMAMAEHWPLTGPMRAKLLDVARMLGQQ